MVSEKIKQKFVNDVLEENSPKLKSDIAFELSAIAVDNVAYSTNLAEWTAQSVVVANLEQETDVYAAQLRTLKAQNAMLLEDSADTFVHLLAAKTKGNDLLLQQTTAMAERNRMVENKEKVSHPVRL